MVVHYTSNHKIRDFKNSRRGEYRQWCTETWENKKVIGQTDDGKPIHDRDYTTSLARVTCVQCLNRLIPKQELLISKMREARSAASVSTETWPTSRIASLPDGILRIKVEGSTDDNTPA